MTPSKTPSPNGAPFISAKHPAPLALFKFVMAWLSTFRAAGARTVLCHRIYKHYAPLGLARFFVAASINITPRWGWHGSLSPHL
ncbi:MAG: hypothetical protein AB7P14_06180 [Blastocatellales bacterium]